MAKLKKYENQLKYAKIYGWINVIGGFLGSVFFIALLLIGYVNANLFVEAVSSLVAGAGLIKLKRWSIYGILVVPFFYFLETCSSLINKNLVNSSHVIAIIIGFAIFYWFNLAKSKFS